MTFTLELLDPTAGDKVQMALGGRAFLKRLNAKAMARLKDVLEAREQASVEKANGGPAAATA